MLPIVLIGKHKKRLSLCRQTKGETPMEKLLKDKLSESNIEDIL